MSQVTIYLDKETKKKMEKAAKASGVSQSKWIREIIRQQTTKEWPEHIHQLAGSWSDFPALEEIRETIGEDSARETL